MSTVVAIHQPNFYPWLGFFNKWVRADVLVLLDDVQFPKTGGGVWTNRCGILQQGQRSWFTAAIDRSFHGVRTVREIELVSDRSWRDKLVRKFQHAYASAPLGHEVSELLAADLVGTQSHLIDLNMDALRRLGAALGLDHGKIILSSSIETTASSTERLADLVHKINGDVYLCGGGAEGYQRDEVFAELGIGLVYQTFDHPIYSQRAEFPFVPGLSILDALSFVGIEGVSRLIRSKDC